MTEYKKWEELVITTENRKSTIWGMINKLQNHNYKNTGKQYEDMIRIGVLAATQQKSLKTLSQMRKKA